MKTIKIVFATIVVVGLAGLAFIYSGVYDAAATTPHNPVTRWIIGTTLHRSVEVHSQGLEAPELTDNGMIETGARHYAEDCAGCHGAPGSEAFEGAKAMYPAPPDLAEEAEEEDAAELFWVIKHGIKMTGMPAWGPTHSDQEIWAIVAFLKQLPGMSAPDFQKLQSSTTAAAEPAEPAAPNRD